MNVTLIGMSGVGKSRVGKQLAKKLNFCFIDIDRVIEESNGKRLQDLIDCLGNEKFLALEENAILSVGQANNCVISPGGSSIYSDKAMAFLKSISKVVFLDASLEEIKSHTGNFSGRGIVGLKEKGLEKLFEERVPLYRKYADITIDLTDSAGKTIVERIIERV